jgi:hypothetical protein
MESPFSKLQLGLALLGLLVLLALAVHAVWQTRRHTPRQPDPFRVAVAAAQAAQAVRIEPSMGESGLASGSVHAADGTGLLGLGSLLGREALAGSERFSERPPERKPALDVLIDTIVPLSLESPVSGEVAVAALPPTRRAGSKPFAIEGLPEGGTVWETPQTLRRYVAFQTGVQLANRTGALNEIEFSEFVTKTRQFADAVGAEPDLPDMLQEVARARELDQFASAHDAQLTFMLRAKGVAWSPGYVQQTAALQGFVPGALPGRMVLPGRSAGAPPLLSLSFDPQAALAEDPNLAALREVTLSLDVAQIDRAEQAFARLCAAALTLAPAMDGIITDDAGHALAEPEMGVIAAELDRLYDTLAARDLAAGSALARRLFS